MAIGFLKMIIVLHLLWQPYRFSAFALQPAQVTGRKKKCYGKSIIVNNTTLKVTLSWNKDIN